MKAILIILSVLVLLALIYSVIRYLAKAPVEPVGFPVLPKKEREKIGPLFIKLRTLVEQSKNQEFLDKMAVARLYMLSLSKTFDTETITEDALCRTFESFGKLMSERGVYQRYQNTRGKLFSMDVSHIVRHTWEHTGRDGVTKTGDDLRAAWPLIYEDDERRSPGDVYIDLRARYGKPLLE